MAFDVAGGLATDAFVADYVMNVEPTINETRIKLMTFTNKMLSYVWEFAGRPQI